MKFLKSLQNIARIMICIPIIIAFGVILVFIPEEEGGDDYECG
jgi:uncharacterized membrane protein